FGYRCDAVKIAVISNPQTGYNAADHFLPGTGNNKYEVRRWSDDVAVFTGTIKPWSSGATHLQSGDKVWWFTFSAVSTPGDYYVYDKTNKVGSCKFHIGDNTYNEAMNAAMRTFYYQRCGVAKSTPFAGTGWTDNACHLGAQQDLDCRLVTNPNISTTRDLHGGWHDAGDYNKYVNFTWSTMISMLLAYEENPSAWSDDYAIPESGNAIPDLLDELRYELQWLLRMQEDNGSLLSVVGTQNFASASPPSADAAFRRYGPATSSASLTASAIFALAAIQFNGLNTPAMTAFADTLETAAVNAYNWAIANPNITFYNSGTVAAGEQEVDDYGRLVRKIASACFLYKLTGNTVYRDVFDNNYNSVHLMQWQYAYPFEGTEQDVLLYYTKVNGKTSAIASAIKSAFSNSVKTNNPDNYPAYKNKTDAYIAFMADQNYTWGNNEFKCVQGSMFMNMVRYNLNGTNATNYKSAAAGFIHYLHGINPVSITYLSNMYAAGGDTCANEFYNSWFTDGSALWDRVGVSTYGPPPGFIPGGANPSYSLDPCCPNGCGGSNSLCNASAVTPPLNQPIQKSYRDWNANWPQDSWSITENAIYTQAAYVKLLSWFLGGTCNAFSGKEEVSLQKISLLLYPNPAGDIITIDADDYNDESVKISIYSMDGRIVLEENNARLPLQLSVHSLLPGNYILKMQSDQQMLTGKFSKQ
ncbi:MAG: glycoside hydrolase family 9 protein, partial [Chitinophagales bacterium]